MGGAPTNFAYHAHALGAESWTITRVGSDPFGLEILDRLRELGLPTDSVQVDAEFPTGTVAIEIPPNGGHKFEIRERVAWDHMEATEEAMSLAAVADALCFGTLGQRSVTSRCAIQSIASATRSDALRIFDINLRQEFYTSQVIRDSLRIANVLKVNEEELPILAAILQITGDEKNQLRQIAAKYDLKLVALTKGPNGSVLMAGDQVSEASGLSVDVADTIGAGDAFTAALALGWLAGWHLDNINHAANQVAAYVCSCEGATPSIPPRISERFHAVSSR